MRIKSYTTKNLNTYPKDTVIMINPILQTRKLRPFPCNRMRKDPLLSQHKFSFVPQSDLFHGLLTPSFTLEGDGLPKKAQSPLDQQEL